jgi:hypothetical protein
LKWWAFSYFQAFSISYMVVEDECISIQLVLCLILNI